MDANEMDAYDPDNPGLTPDRHDADPERGGLDTREGDRIALMASLLPLSGRPVDRIIQSPFQLRVDIETPEGHTFIVEGETTLHCNGLPDWTGSPEGDNGLQQAARIAADEVSGVYVSPEGTLRIDFEGGDYLETASSPDFEAWEIHTDEGLLAVCLAGGALSLYTQETPT